MTLARFPPGAAALLLALPATAVGAFLVSNRTNGSIVSAGRTRRYLLHVPDSYDGIHPVPLVVNIHGFAQWPANQERVSRWSEVADQEGFIVVYPKGTGLPLRWASWKPGAPETAADIQFLTDLLDELTRDYAIDPDRVFVTGISNGGGMAVALSSALSERIAAIGTVAGLFAAPPDAWTRSRPVPLIAFHGTADPLVPYDGGPLAGPGGDVAPVREWIADYAAHNGGADVVLHTVEGGGHNWPGGRPLPRRITGPTSTDIDATRMMWEFFRDHPLHPSPDQAAATGTAP